MRQREFQTQFVQKVLSPQGQIQSHVQVLLQKEKDIVQEKTGGEQKIDVFMVRKVVPETEGYLLMLLESLITLMLWKRPSDKENGTELYPVPEE
jgi:hypothetical protein